MNTIKFFVPKTESSEQSDRIYKTVKEFIKGQGYAHNHERIYCVRFWHNGVLYTDTVGEPAGLEPNEIVIAIFQASDNLCYICTENRGVYRGAPIMCNPVFTVPFAE